MIKKNIKEINGKGARASVIRYTALEIQFLRHKKNELGNTLAEFYHQKEETEDDLIEFAENSSLRIGLVRHLALLTEDISNYNDLINEIKDIIAAYDDQTDDDEEGGGIKKGKSLKSSKWIDHVKAHSKEHNISYKQALKSAKDSYKK